MEDPTLAFISGWVGGIAGVLTSHPLDTIRTRQVRMHVKNSATRSRTDVGARMQARWQVQTSAPQHLLLSCHLSCENACQAVSRATILQTFKAIVNSAGGARNLYAGVLSPCVSVGLWKATTLGLNQSLMSFVASAQQGTPHQTTTSGNTDFESPDVGGGEDGGGSGNRSLQTQRALPLWQVRQHIASASTLSA